MGGHQPRQHHSTLDSKSKLRISSFGDLSSSHFLEQHLTSTLAADQAQNYYCRYIRQHHSSKELIMKFGKKIIEVKNASDPEWAPFWRKFFFVQPSCGGGGGGVFPGRCLRRLFFRTPAAPYSHLNFRHCIVLIPPCSRLQDAQGEDQRHCCHALL